MHMDRNMKNTPHFTVNDPVFENGASRCGCMRVFIVFGKNGRCDLN